MTRLERISRRAFAPVDIAGLAVFRVLFGAVMLVDFVRYWIAGWIDSHFITPAFLFTYFGFEWVQPLPRPGMYAVFAVLMLASVAVSLGLTYRLAIGLLFIGHTYIYLLSATHYLNHAYLLSVVILLMACIPAGRGLSIDGWRGRRGRAWAPAWSQWLLRVQLGIVYVFGGIAKINPDWAAGEPVRGWLRSRANTTPELVSELLRSEAVTGLVVYGGLWFDLLIAPALWWRRTRWLAVLVSVGFHLSNAYLFSIGVFPWFMLAATTLFLEPDWPRRIPWLGRWIDRALGPVPKTSPTEADGAGVAPSDGSTAASESPRHPRWILGLLAGWLLLQVVLPLRHHLYPGNVAWTEEGHYYAWRMKLRTKSGAARFVVTDPVNGDSWVVDPRDELTKRQTRKMIGKPQLLAQYARHLAGRWREEHGVEVEVRVQVQVSLNRRPRQQLVDPTVDLAAYEPSLWPAPWIMPGPTSPVPITR